MARSMDRNLSSWRRRNHENLEESRKGNMIGLPFVYLLCMSNGFNDAQFKALNFREKEGNHVKKVEQILCLVIACESDNLDII